MATQVALAIKIESQGGEKVLKNLQDLETELGLLQKDLKTLDFGTQEFETAVKNINKIKSAIKDVDKATEGLETAQRVQAISEAVSIVVASFQLLTGVIGIFISDSEDLEKVQRFEAKAVGVLNAVLGIQTILYQRAELAAKGYSISALASEAANKALALATSIATGAQKLFNAALKANPIGLVVAGVIALTGAIAGLVKIYNSFFSEAAQVNRILEEQSEIESELIKTKFDSARQIKDQLTILTDNVRTRALERKTLEDLKKTYAGFNAFIDENNKLTKEGITFLELQIQLRQQEAALTTISQRRVAKEIEFETEANRIRQEYGASADILIKELRERYEVDFTAINNVQNKYTKALNNTLNKLAPYEKKLKDTAEAEAKAAKEADKNEKVISKQAISIQKLNEALKDRLELLGVISNRLKSVQAAELTFATDVLDVQNDIIDKQNALLGEREDILDRNKQIIEDLSRLFFQTIPGEEDLRKTNSAVFDLITFLKVNLETLGLRENLGFDDLIDLFVQAGNGGEEVVEILKSIPDETKISINEFFNSYKLRVAEIQKSLQEDQGTLAGFFADAFPDEDLFKLLLEVEKQQSELFKNRVNNGLTELQILEEGKRIVRDRLGFTDKIVGNIAKQQQILINLNAEQQKGANADQDKIKGYQEQLRILDEQNQKYDEIVQVILDGVVKNNQFTESVENTEKQFEKTAVQIAKNKKLIDETFDPEKLKEYFSSLSGEELRTIFPTLILDLQAYLDRFGAAGTEAIIKGVVDGLIEAKELTKQGAEDIVNVLEKAGLALKTFFGFAFDPFAEQIKLLKSLLGGLEDEASRIPEAFVNIQQKTQDYFKILDDLSGRLSDVIAQNNANLLDQLQYEESVALAQIGEANAATAKENERIEAERAAVQEKYAKQRFELEKKARVQELQFALAAAISGGAQAVINALATIPPPLGAVYAAGLGVLTGAQVQVINNQLTTAKSKAFVARRGGLINGESHEGSNGGVPTLLEGGEFVVNREAVARFGNIISDLNSATGGRKLAIDDSRLVQAIASQNQTSPPLKAYVLYNSITDTEKLNKKITQLSRL